MSRSLLTIAELAMSPAVATGLPWQRMRALARRAKRWARYESERYIWHELELQDARPFSSRVVDTTGMVVREAVVEDMPALASFNFPALDRYDEFIAHGGVLWAVDSDDGVVAAFWVFHSEMPLYPWFALPQDTIAIEHGTVSEQLRGLGFGPVALCSKLIDLYEAGNRIAVTKIMDDNNRSLKTARRIGFRPTCLMYRRTIAGRTRTIVEPWTPFGRHLSENIDAPHRPGIAPYDSAS